MTRPGDAWNILDLELVDVKCRCGLLRDRIRARSIEGSIWRWVGRPQGHHARATDSHHDRTSQPMCYCYLSRPHAMCATALPARSGLVCAHRTSVYMSAWGWQFGPDKARVFMLGHASHSGVAHLEPELKSGWIRKVAGTMQTPQLYHQSARCRVHPRPRVRRVLLTAAAWPVHDAPTMYTAPASPRRAVSRSAGATRANSIRQPISVEPSRNVRHPLGYPGTAHLERVDKTSN